MNRRRVAFVAVAALAIVALGAFGYARFLRAVEVPIVEAAQGTVAVRVVGPGTVQARVPVTLAARITATVRQLDAELLRAGFVSQSVLDASDAALRAAEANLDNARAALAAREAEARSLSQELR